MDDFDACAALFAQALNLVEGQGGMAAVYVTDDIGAGFEHHILVDQSGTRDRRSAGMNGGLDTVFARPVDHQLRLVAGLDATEADFAEQLYPCLAKLLEVFLDHSFFEDRRAGVHFDAADRERRKTALGGNPQRDDAFRILRAAGQVNFAGRNHRGDAAMHGRIDPVGLVLARRPVAEHRMDMAVDQPGTQGRAVGVDGDVGGFGVDVLFLAESRDAAVDRYQRIGVEHRVFERAGQHQPDIPDYGFTPGRFRC